MISRIIVLFIFSTIAPVFAEAQSIQDIERGFRIFNDMMTPPRGAPQPRQEWRGGGQPPPSGPSREEENYAREWRQVQNRLNELGYDAGPANGQPGLKTKEAIERFQETNGLERDGKIGPKTRSVLFSAQALAAQFAGSQPSGNGAQSVPVEAPDWAAAQNGGTGAGSSPSPTSSTPPIGATSETTGGRAILGKILPHPSQPGTVIGQWEGVAQCAEGRSLFMTLAIAGAGGIRFSAETGYAWERFLAGEHLKQRLIGEKTGEDSYEFVFQDNISSDYDLARYADADFTLAFDKAGDTLTGQFSGKNCTSFALTRTTEKSKSRVYVLNGALPPARFYTLKTLAEKCSFLRDYFETPFSEQKELERSKVERNNTGLIMLSDRYFVPAFGTVVDGLSKARKQQVLSDYVQCRQDPIWKARLEPYHSNIGSIVLFWGFQDGLRDYEKPVPPTAADLNFWKMRYARNEVYLAVKSTAAGDDPSDILQKIAVAEDRIRHFEALFFPGEIAELKVNLGDANARAFRVQADAKLRSLTDITDDVERIAAIRRLYDTRLSDIGGARPDVVEAYETELEVQQLESFKRLLAPLLSMSPAADVDATSTVKEFEKKVVELSSLSDNLIPAVKTEADRLIAEKRQALIAEAIGRDLERLASIEATAQGVKESARRAELMTITYSRYPDHASVKNLNRAIVDHREKLLMAAFPAFKVDLEATSAAGSAKIREVAIAYLGWSGDRDLAASKPYYVALAGAELSVLDKNPSDMARLVQSKTTFDDRAGYRKALPAVEFAEFEKAVLMRHDAAARSLVFRVIDLNAVTTLEGVEKARASLAKADAVFSKMIPDAASRLKSEIDGKMASAVLILVDQEIGKLDAIPANRQGIQVSTVWIANFDGTFGAFKDRFDYETARKRFLEHREKLLTSALPTFEKEVQASASARGPQGVDDLLRSYLSWNGDEQFPVALEYQFIAEAAK